MSVGVAVLGGAGLAKSATLIRALSAGAESATTSSVSSDLVGCRFAGPRSSTSDLSHFGRGWPMGAHTFHRSVKSYHERALYKHNALLAGLGHHETYSTKRARRTFPSTTGSGIRVKARKDGASQCFLCSCDMFSHISVLAMAV